MSLGEFIGPVQELGMKFKHVGVVAMAPTCCGKKIGRIWTSFWYKLLANWSFPQEGSWFREGTCHLRVRNDICTLPNPALIFYTARLDQIEVSC